MTQTLIFLHRSIPLTPETTIIAHTHSYSGHFLSVAFLLCGEVEREIMGAELNSYGTTENTESKRELLGNEVHSGKIDSKISQEKRRTGGDRER